MRTVREHFGLDLDAASGAWAGEESVGWRVPSPDGDRFVQRFPTWRTLEELTWCDGVAVAASSVASSCVRAVATSDGRVVIPSTEGPCMVFPFADGHHTSGLEGNEAAALLAAIHRGIASGWTPLPEPPDRRTVATMRDDVDRRLRDDDLDRCERSIVTHRKPTLPIHGDFYPGNLLTRRNRIVGVIDWSEARIEHHEQEVSWAMWEWCRTDNGDDVEIGVAEEFLGAYLDADGPARVGPPFDPIPWVRRRLRWEAAAWLVRPEALEDDSEYHGAQLRAFHRLKGRRLPGRGDG